MTHRAGPRGWLPASGLCALLICLTGCSAHTREASLMPSSPKDIAGSFNDPGTGQTFSSVSLQHFYSPVYSDAAAHPPPPARRAAMDDDAVPAGCDLGDRFDNDHALAYNFSDGQSRIGLGLDMDSGFHGVQFNAVRVEFRFKLQPIKSRKEKCHYNSQWQGLVGSSYNEFFLRRNNTIWREISDRGLDFWN